MSATAWIDRAAIARNVATLAARAPGARVCAVVKADGYGHGMATVARASLEGGATWLAVATPDEAVALGPVAGTVPVLLLSEPDPDDLAAAWADLPAGCRPTVASASGLATIARLADPAHPTPVHVVVDTGMHRCGVDPAGLATLLGEVAASPAVRLEAVWTHFAVADDPDDPFTGRQIQRFDEAVHAVPRLDPDVWFHLANSAGVIAHPAAHRDLVRLGIAMYGVAPSAALADAVALEPALRLTAPVIAVRTVDPGESVSYGRRWFATEPTRVATLAIGYADGIRRSSPGHGVEVLIRGRRRPMLGVVTMDQTMVAVDDEVTVGDEAVLIGGQGGERITAEEVADRLGTIGYEVLTDIGGRVRRVPVS